VSIGESFTTGDGLALWTLEEISRLISERNNASETLTNAVNLIRRRFETDVCSVYLLEPDRANLASVQTARFEPNGIQPARSTHR